MYGAIWKCFPKRKENNVLPQNKNKPKRKCLAFLKYESELIKDVTSRHTNLCSTAVYVEHVMSNVSPAHYDLIWHIEHRAYNQREHALKTRVEISEQRSL